MSAPYRCCEHCERDSEGRCEGAPNGDDTHVVGCMDWCVVGNERVQVLS